MSINFTDIAILNIKGSDYRCINRLISINEAINVLQNADLTEKGGTLHQHIGPTSIKNIDTNKTVVSNKVSFGKKGVKYFIDYKDAKGIRPLCIFLPKMSAYKEVFDEPKYTCFLIKDDEFSG